MTCLQVINLKSELQLNERKQMKELAKKQKEVDSCISAKMKMEEELMASKVCCTHRAISVTSCDLL